MTCRPGTVLLAGWTHSYSVDITDIANPRTAVAPERFDPQRSPPAANLSLWSKEQVIDLTSDSSPGEFQLVIARVSRKLSKGSEHYTFTHIIRRESNGGVGERILASVKLFQGIFRETAN